MLLAKYGVSVPKGTVAETAQQAKDIQKEMGAEVVIKAQVYAGGRGKAGGVRVVKDGEEAINYATTLLGSRLVTKQTGTDGVPVGKLLVEETASIAKELYLALIIDRSSQGPVFIASKVGGVEIEEIAETNPEQIANEPVDVAVGLLPFQMRRIGAFLDLNGDQLKQLPRIMLGMYQAFIDLDCTMIEINPLAVTVDDKIVALDAKMDLEDDALFRHPELAFLPDPDQEEPLELLASNAGVAYVKMSGTVGCLVNGAGLAMATMDLIKGAGLEPANFLDVGGGADDEKVSTAMDIMLSDPEVKLVLVNIFGGILRCDIVARGVVNAFKKKGSTIPMIVRMSGTNVDEGRTILEESGLGVSFASNLETVLELLRSE